MRARDHLEHGVEAVLVGAEHGGLVVQVRARLLGLVRAVVAVPRAAELLRRARLRRPEARRRRGEHRHDEHARGRLARLLDQPARRVRAWCVRAVQTCWAAGVLGRGRESAGRAGRVPGGPHSLSSSGCGGMRPSTWRLRSAWASCERFGACLNWRRIRITAAQSSRSLEGAWSMRKSAIS